MARIAGVDIPREKRLEVSLTYIYGVGRTTAGKICAANGVDLREPLNPTFPADAHESTFPSVSVMDTMVLLNELLMCTTP